MTSAQVRNCTNTSASRARAWDSRLSIGPCARWPIRARSMSSFARTGNRSIANAVAHITITWSVENAELQWRSKVQQSNAGLTQWPHSMASRKSVTPWSSSGSALTAVADSALLRRSVDRERHRPHMHAKDGDDRNQATRCPGTRARHRPTATGGSCLCAAPPRSE